MKQTATETQYRAAFNKEVSQDYLAMNEAEIVLGYAIDRVWISEVAYTLNCPVKTNRPNWQHGRLIYALIRNQLEALGSSLNKNSVLLDIGTAKGFSAVVMAKALEDSGTRLPILTVDVTDPRSRIVRNTVAEIGGLKTLYELVNPVLPVNQEIRYFSNGSAELLIDLVRSREHVMFAFVDGKHTYSAVKYEGEMLYQCQREGDIVLFDDCQLPPVEKAVDELVGYTVFKLDIGPRRYAVAKRLA